MLDQQNLAVSLLPSLSTNRKTLSGIMSVFVPSYAVSGFTRSPGRSSALHVHCLGDRDLVLSETAALERAARWTAWGHSRESFQISRTAGALTSTVMENI